MKTKLPEKIETEEQAKAFLQQLIDNDEVYHPEDDAHDISWSCLSPTPEECDKLNELMGQIYDLDPFFDPCGFIMDSGYFSEQF